MIFVLHYLLFNAGLSATLILLTLFLQTYSDASLTEIGTLLMLLPFLSILVKPLFCALADRQQAHKAYLIGSLLLEAIGYGSLAIPPFFPDFVQQHGRLVWFFDIVGIVIGFSAFGVAWSLGDALSVNGAAVRGIPWGSYRVWATVSWGAFGLLVGQINETPLLPKYVPAFLLLAGTLLLECVVIALWPNKRDFDMSYEGENKQKQTIEEPSKISQEQLEAGEAGWPINKSFNGTLSGSVRNNPRLMGAVANIFMEDIGSSLKASLKLGQPQKRAALADLLEQHDLSGSQQQPTSGGQTPVLTRQLASSQVLSPLQQLEQQSAAVPSSLPNDSQLSGTWGKAGTFGRSALLRTQLALSRMDSLSSVSGHAIAHELRRQDQHQDQRQVAMPMNSLTNSASLSRAAAARLVSQQSKADANLEVVSDANQQLEKGEKDLQLVLLKLIIKRDASVLKYLTIFTLFGMLMTVHIAFFFMYVEQLCRDKGFDFSSVMGSMAAAQSLSEILTFLIIVPYVVPRIGRLGSMLTCGIVYGIRYAFYGTYYAQLSPYTALATETCHGIAYGIIYTLITDIACECVDHVDLYLPELIERRIVEPNINPNQLKLPLRATMQGVFSGAFDGLGNGLGALIAGIYLDVYTFKSLWLLCAYVSLAFLIIYPITEWRLILGRDKK